MSGFNQSYSSFGSIPKARLQHQANASDVAGILGRDAIFREGWEEVASSLIPPAAMAKLRRTPVHDICNQIVNHWTSFKGNKATIGSLRTILKNHQFNGLSDELQTRYTDDAPVRFGSNDDDANDANSDLLLNGFAAFQVSNDAPIPFEEYDTVVIKNLEEGTGGEEFVVNKIQSMGVAIVTRKRFGKRKWLDKMKSKMIPRPYGVKCRFSPGDRQETRIHKLNRICEEPEFKRNRITIEPYRKIQKNRNVFRGRFNGQKAKTDVKPKAEEKVEVKPESKSHWFFNILTAGNSRMFY